MSKQPNKLDKAKATIVLDYPFFASLLLRHPLVEREDIPTLAVDMRGTIYYNPKFIETLSTEQLVWGLCHEVLHRVGQHGLRRGHRHPMAWNYAGDAWINDVLDDAKIGQRIPNTVDMRGSKDDTVENIYDKLPIQKVEEWGAGDGLGNDVIDGEGMSESEKAEAEATTKIETAQAAQAAKMRGKLPGALERFIHDILYPKTPWYEILEKFMTNIAQTEYSWKRPNRRFTPMGAYLPIWSSQASMGPVVIGVDTSGSIGERELAFFGGHIKRIIGECNPERVYVVYCDAAINHVDEYTPNDYDSLALSPHGGGGTDMREIFNYIDREGIEADCIIVLTDGYTPFPDSVPAPTMWAISSDVKAPDAAGETIHFSMDD